MPPVILIHGFWDSAADLRALASHLERAGRAAHRLDLIPNNARIRIEEMARGVEKRIAELIPGDGEFDMVGHSMGGLVARYYTQRLDRAHRVRRLITIASPHAGTWTAWLLRRPGIRQMRPGSDFLKDLEKDVEKLERVRFTSIWTPFDLMILPASSSAIAAARSIRVPVIAHPLMLTSRRVLRLVEETLSEPV